MMGGVLSFGFPKFSQFYIDLLSSLSPNFLIMLNIFELAILPLLSSFFFYSLLSFVFGLLSKMDLFLRMGGRPVTAAKGSFYLFSVMLEEGFESCD